MNLFNCTSTVIFDSLYSVFLFLRPMSVLRDPGILLSPAQTHRMLSELRRLFSLARNITTNPPIISNLSNPIVSRMFEPICGRGLIDLGHIGIQARPDRGGKMRTRKLRMQRKVKRQQSGVNQTHDPK